MKTFEEAWENTQKDYPELTASSYVGLSLNRTKEMARKIWQTAQKEHEKLVAEINSGFNKQGANI